MVWKTDGSSVFLKQMLDMLRTMQSFAWQDPALFAHPPEGWRLAFQAAHSTDGYLVLTLWPEPTD